MPENVDLLSTVAVAEILRIERSTVSRWVKEGRMPPPIMRLAPPTGALVFDRAAVLRFRDDLIALAEAAAQEPVAS